MIFSYCLKTKSVLFDTTEDYELRRLLIKAGIDPSWFADVRFYWNSEMGQEVNGAFTILEPDAIFLTKSFRGCLDRLAATAAHELCHKNDFHSYSLLYHIMAIPGLRQWFLEVKAENVELMVNEKLGIDERFRL